jgi:AcrR family transcriptional regulator
MAARTPAAPSNDTREALLERAVSHVARHGLADASLRSIALALGTSHRMLIYHFGSAEEFWSAVLAGLRMRERLALSESAARGRFPTIRATWEGLAAPGNLPRMRLLFETYGRALAEPDRFRGFLATVVSDWLDTVGDALGKQYRVTPRQARLQARLRLAVLRGLVLDLLTTGDRAGTTAALRWFATRAGLPPRNASRRTRRRTSKGSKS